MKKPSCRSKFSSPLAAIALLGISKAIAAPCCGGGAAIPTLITGDDRAQIQGTYSYGSVIGDAPARGVPVFRADGDQERTQTLRWDGAYRVLDRWQLGAGVPVVSRDRAVIDTSGGSSARATGLGDATLSVAYDALPEWSYSAWRPHGLAFLQATLPTSPSTYDAVAPYQLDARGRGFFTLGAGAAFLKTVSNWDFLATVEGHRSFQRTVTAPDGSTLLLRPGYGASATAGLGWSPDGSDFRAGISLSPAWEGPIQARGEVDSSSSPQIAWSVAAQLSYLFTSDWSATLSYTDQTLLGPARNTSLSRIAGASLQKRWPL